VNENEKQQQQQQNTIEWQVASRRLYFVVKNA
jgi:hypothetical protein